MTDQPACEDCGRRYPSVRAAIVCCLEEYRGDRYTEEQR